jgi:ADP-heptose:LPS heptosyltransferase
MIIHPVAKGEEKLWDLHEWVKVIEQLYDTGTKVVLVGSQIQNWGGAVVNDLQYCQAIQTALPHACINLAGKVEDINILAAIIKRARLYCGLDTGPTHLAALLGTPVVEIYKFTDMNTFELWKPYPQNVSVIAQPDLRTVTAEVVLKKINKTLFDKKPIPEPSVEQES